MVEDYQENYITGWIKLHRSITKHWIFSDADKFKAWITILCEVNHKPNKVVLGNILLDCNIGESLNSLDTWSKLFGSNWNKSKVRRFFNLLEKDNMIVTKSEQKTTRLTVCNYETYQQTRNASETQVKHKRNASETQATPNNNDNNIKNDNKRVYSDEIFLNDWNTIRSNITKKPSHLNRLNFELSSIVKKLDREETQNALKGFFKQKYFPRGQDYTVNPKHFLNHFEIYLQAYHDKNPNVWGKEE